LTVTLNILFFSFLSSWLAKILDFGMQYTHIFHGVKLFFANRNYNNYISDFQLKANAAIKDHARGFEERQQMYNEYISTMTQYSKILSLLSCVYCLSVWIGLIAMIGCMITGFCWYHLSIPIFSFFITNKT